VEVPAQDADVRGITGQSFLNTELSAKRLALLKDTLPRARRIAMLVYADAGPDRDVRETRTAAQHLGLHVQRVDVRLEDLPRSFSDAKKERAATRRRNGPMRSTCTLVDRGQPALRDQLDEPLAVRDYVDAGGLMSYGQNLTLLFRRAAVYVHKNLKGATPDDLPWEHPSQFELIVNLKTAKALGLTFPPSLLPRADQVLE
jgi:putative ABC transport system substrate-binding protein